MKPIYERKTEDWARRALNQILDIKPPRFQSKEAQWHNIVAKCRNFKDDYTWLQDRMYEIT